MTSINSSRTALDIVKKSDDVALKYHAIWWLGKNKVQEAQRILCEVLNEDHDRTELGGYPLRRQAARSLGMLANPQAVQSLINSLNTSDLRLQEASILALRSINDSRVAPTLIEYLKAPSSSKPMEALIEALAAFEIWEVEKLIRPYLNDNSKRIQGAAGVYFYRMTRDQEYLKNIINNLSDQNAFLRQSAAFDLAQCHDASLDEKVTTAKLPNNVKMAVLKQILELYIAESNLSSPTNFLSDKTTQSLISKIDILITDAIQGNLPSTHQVRNNNTVGASPLQLTKQHLIELIEQNPAGHEQLLETLQEDKPADCTPICKACLENHDQDIRAAIVQLLYYMKCTQAAAALQKVIGLEIANHCQGKIRRVALLALGKLYHEFDEGQDTRSSIQSTLHWALTEPDDWGLRYSAVMAYEVIACAKPVDFELFADSKSCQTDPIIDIRIAIAESNLSRARCGFIPA